MKFIMKFILHKEFSKRKAANDVKMTKIKQDEKGTSTLEP